MDTSPVIIKLKGTVER